MIWPGSEMVMAEAVGSDPLRNAEESMRVIRSYPGSY